MKENNNEERTSKDTSYSYYVGVKFSGGNRAYFFGTDIIDLKLDEMVVVDSLHGMEIGFVAIKEIPISKYKSTMPLKPVIRRANKTDIALYEKNRLDEPDAFLICQEEIKKLSLPMNLISAKYNLDRSKILISYLSDDRVDFRELLKALAYRFKTRIELRQIGTRDKAKMVGGLGVCGLPLCCSLFLNEFDGISISRAKNQMLAINIPKLSGHCGKLVCCLKYEDDAYSEIKKDFPQIGDKVVLEKNVFKVTSMNLISQVIKIENEDDVRFLPLHDFNKLPKAKWDKE